jgi:hypothetical protein
MGTSIWTFLRPRPGDLHPVTQRAADDFLCKASRLPADEEGFVRYAQVIMSLEKSRRAPLYSFSRRLKRTL